MTGDLITIEGVDGTGKSTVVNGLQEFFQDAVFTAEPYPNSWSGRLVRSAIYDNNDTIKEEDLESILKNKDVNPMAVYHLFLADHYNHLENEIRPALNEGRTVICDRYIDSRFAYQGVELEGLVDGDTLEWIISVEETKNNIEPDLTILLDLDIDTCFERLDETEQFEKKKKIKKYQANYDRLKDIYEYRYIEVDASGTKEEVINRVREEIEQYFSN